MADQIFHFSPGATKKKRQTILTLQALLPLLLVILLVTTKKSDLEELNDQLGLLARYFVMIVAVMEFSLWLAGRLFIERLKQITVRLTAQNLELVDGSKTEKLPYTEITGVTLTRLPNGENLSLKAWTPHSSLLIRGIDEIGTVIDRLNSGRENPLPIKIKVAHFDWSEPRMAMAVLMALTCLVIAVQNFAFPLFEAVGRR